MKALELKHEIEGILLAPGHPNEKMESILLLLEKDFPELTCSLKGELGRLARLNPVDAVLNIYAFFIGCHWNDSSVLRLF